VITAAGEAPATRKNPTSRESQEETRKSLSETSRDYADMMEPTSLARSTSRCCVGITELSAQSWLCRCRHNHDLRHTGNQFASESKAGLRDLMARMGHDSERAAMIYQHKARGADKSITDAIDAHVRDQQAQGDGGTAGALVPAG
jgi:integrase